MRKAQTPPLSPDDTLLDSLRLVVAEGLDHFEAHRAETQAGDDEAIHQARVALRRLRSALKLYRHHLSPAARDGFNDMLRAMGRTLGAARDWDVFVLETVPAIAEAMPDEATLLMQLVPPAQHERERAHLALQALMENSRTGEALHELRAWSGTPAAFLPPGKGRLRLEDKAAALLDRLAATARRRGRKLAAQDDEQRHALRKSLKALRYGIEMLEALHAQAETKPYRRALSGLQEDLGLLNDAIAAVELVYRLPDCAGRAVVERWSDEQKRAALAALPGAWRQFKQMPAFW